MDTKYVVLYHIDGNVFTDVFDNYSYAYQRCFLTRRVYHKLYKGDNEPTVRMFKVTRGSEFLTCEEISI